MSAADQPSISTALDARQLYHACPPDALGFASTQELDALQQPLGQQRAMDALAFGMSIAHEGYNLFVMGAPGVGRHTVVRQLLEDAQAGQPSAQDLCFVNNFHTPHKPRALRLSAGLGSQLQADMRQLARDLYTALPAAFDSDAYRAQRQQLDNHFKSREEEALESVRDEAEKRSIALLQTPMGYTLAPAKNGSVIDPKSFDKLSDKEKKALEQSTEVIREQLTDMLRQAAVWHKEHAQLRNELDDRVASQVAEASVTPIRKRYADLPEVLSWLDEVQSDIAVRSEDILKFAAETRRMPANGEHITPFTHYDVNLLVDNAGISGSPVIYADHPSYQNLFGRIEHMAQFGTLITNFTLIKGGALHRANGGYLVLDARKLLQQPFVWDALKRALFARELRIESLERMLSLASTITLEPEPVPLNVKVVLVGERLLYYLLSQYDPDFNRLFKVQADFAEDVPRDEDNTQLYARLVATLLQRESLRPASADAVARLIEQAARIARDGHKLSLNTEDLRNLLREADHFAAAAKAGAISRDHVQQALDGRRDRASRLREQMQESVLNGLRLIATEGAAVAQINGLAVLQLGEQSFGHPSRITATARLGDGKIIDIEREVELGQAIHSKGVMILGAHLAQRFARHEPLSFSASLVFEQSYGAIDGDSASMAELCALISALSELPLRQDLAITGSVNQLGQMQVIGGVNEKIEGFFDLCLARGLTGTQGVIIPAANQRHLMLRADIVEAAKAGRFSVHVAETVDQVMALLTGLPAGEPDAAGQYPTDSVNGRVQRRLREMSRQRQRFAHPNRRPGKDEIANGDD